MNLFNTVFDNWKHRASRSDFDDMQQHNDNQLARIFSAADKAGDEYRRNLTLGILLNRIGLNRDKDK